MQSPSIMFLRVGKSAARAVTSVLWGMRKGCVLRGKSHAGGRMSYCVTTWRDGYCGGELSNCAYDADVWSCTRGMMCLCTSLVV